MRHIYSYFLSLITIIVISSAPTIAHAAEKPKGKIVYHSYSDYNAQDSNIYLYDFGSDTLACLSTNWSDIKNPMNACFRKDGKAITFMGQTTDDEWDIYEYTFGEKNPRNLTKGNGLDDEDPKYDPKGKYIIFKQSNPKGKGTRIVRYSLKSSRQKVLITGSSEKSMPYYSKNGKKIFYVEGKGKNMFIKVASAGNKNGTSSKENRSLYKEAGVQSYYPIVSDNGKYLYFSKGYNKCNRVDQIIRYNLKTGKAKSLKCNSRHYDCSDACCVSSKYIIVSSSKKGGRGGYDLYLVNVKTGAMTSLSAFNQNINTPLEELGCDYYDG
ncbi:TolB family protein [Butyrivibrio sp. WCD3002]|uniref:TolB family protein n=1 Tax=Butyrivibrio sp. WCD3002 TaxID=1280676 RepID=UPI000409F41C|nr:hypothetical protein [Butyrivibrio sp. WCD3002]